MTVGEMHQRVSLYLDRVSANLYDDFESGEIDSYLTDAQLQFIKDRFRQFEKDARRIGDLYSIVRHDFQIPVTQGSDLPTGSPYEWLIPYPTSYMYPISVEPGITRTDNPTISTKEYVLAQPIKHDDIMYFQVNSHNTPWIRFPKALFRDEWIHLFADAETTVVDCKLTYIPYPDDIFFGDSSNSPVNSELPDHTHDEVVSIAVMMMMNDIEKGDFRFRREQQELVS